MQPKPTHYHLLAKPAGAACNLGCSYCFFLSKETYLPLGRKTVLGLRGDGQFSRGDVPFYTLPFIKLRGIPAMR